MTMSETDVKAKLILSWLAVGLPLGWGVLMTLLKAAQLFR